MKFIIPENIIKEEDIRIEGCIPPKIEDYSKVQVNLTRTGNEYNYPWVSPQDFQVNKPNIFCGIFKGNMDECCKYIKEHFPEECEYWNSPV